MKGTTTTMTAIEYAHSVEANPEIFSWRQLERETFASIPAVIPLIDALTAELDNKKVSRWRTTLALVGGLYMFLMYFAPMITAGILLVGSTQDGDPAALLAWAGAFAVGQIIFRIGEWIRAARGGEPAGAQEALMVAVNVAFSLLTTWTAYTYATFEAPPGAWLYFALFLVMTLACLASVILMRVRGRAKDRGELVFNLSTSSALAAEIARRPEAERDSITQDLSTALDLLVAVRAITANERQDALRRDLGDLTEWRWSQDLVSRRRK